MHLVIFICEYNYKIFHSRVRIMQFTVLFGLIITALRRDNKCEVFTDFLIEEIYLFAQMR